MEEDDEPAKKGSEKKGSLKKGSRSKSDGGRVERFAGENEEDWPPNSSRKTC